MRFLSRHGLFAFLSVALAASVCAQDAPRGGETQSSAVVGFPFEGEVTCEYLNVRLAPKADPGAIIASVLRQGEKVIALDEAGDYFVVRPPRGASVWIYGRHVQKESDGTGTVLVNDAALRLDSRVTAEKVGVLQEGAKVTILREHLGWCQIAAPDAVRYYAARKYIRVLGPAADSAVPASTKTPVAAEDAEARALISQAEKTVDEQNRLIAEARIEEVDFEGVVEAYQAAFNMAKSEELRREAERGRNSFRVFQNMLVAVKGNLAAARELIDKHREMLEAKWRTPEPKWAATGYVELVGPIIKRPGTHKLVMGGKVLCFLTFKEGDEAMRLRLNGFYGKYVGVNGPARTNVDGWPGVKVITVESIEAIQAP